MTGKQKLNLLSRPSIDDRIHPSYRSLRYDPLVWKEWLEIDEEAASQIPATIPGGNINPGNFALYRLSEKLIKDGYPNVKIETILLEECMNEYQLFLQDTISPIDLRQAAELAIVLIEKRKISESWGNVLSEISSRFRGNSTEEFVKKWRTVIGIVENLVETGDKLLSSLCLPEASEFLKNLFIPAIMMLGQPDAQRLVIVQKAVEGLTIQQQLSVLTELVEIGEDVLARSAAEYLVSKNNEVDLSSSTVETYWDRPFESQYAVSFNQCLALIAHIAGNIELEERLLTKADEILKATQAGIELQRSRIKQNDLDLKDKGTDVDIASGFDVPKNIQLTFLAKDTDSNESTKENGSENITEDAKKIADSGNEEIAFQTVMNKFNQDPTGFVKEISEKRPRFNPDWQPTKKVNDLIDIGAFKPAELINNSILDKNPSNYLAIQQSMKIKKATGRFEDYVDLLESKVFCGKPVAADLRELIVCDQQLGRNKEAFEVSELLQKSENVTLTDRIQHAALCGKIGKKEFSKKILDKIIEEDPENVDALCARGELYVSEHDFDKAVLALTKAAELSEGNPDPWIHLSNCYSEQGNVPLSIETLKKGIVAFPGNTELKTKLAAVMMDQGMIADALPILKELAGEYSDKSSALMLVQALKALHDPELDDYITELYSVHPDEPEICIQYADLKLKYGGYGEAAKIIKGIQADFSKNSDWARVYADSIAGLDPRFTKNAKQLRNEELEESLRAINSYPASDPILGMQNQCIKAELLIQKGYVEEAHSILQEIFENGSELSNNWFIRMQTWFAWTSAALGKVDIALSTIRDVIDSDPSLLGAQQVLAEILAFSNQTQEALDQAQLVVEMAPDLVENLLWAGEFFSNLGEIDRALQVLSDGSKLVPEDIRFDLSIAQLYALKGESEKEEELLESIKIRIDQNVDSKILMDFSKVMEKTGDFSFVESILQKRYDESPELKNAMNLAGYEYQHGEMEKALAVLDAIKDTAGRSQVLDCLRADTLLNLGRTESALAVLDRAQSEAVDSPVDLGEFIPSTWNSIQHSQDPITELKVRIHFELGKVEKSKEYALKILEKDPKNPMALLFLYEYASAFQDQEMQEKVKSIGLPEWENQLFPHLFLQKMEFLLDQNKVDECWEFYNALDDRLKSIPEVRVVEATLLFIEGNLKEAETIFLECKSNLIDLSNPSFILRMIDARVMIKIAWKLFRWDEAIKWASEWSKAYPWNLKFTQIYAKILVEALEFRELANWLNIKQHSPSVRIDQLNPLDQFDWILNIDKDNDDTRRWILRGKLAIHPDQNLVRTYALNKPSAEDAVVLIRALAKIGQDATAEQIARKFGNDEGVLLEMAFEKRITKPDEALGYLNTLIELRSTNPVGLALRGLILDSAGKRDQAVMDIESALIFWPDELEWHKKAGELWRSLGNETKAISHLEYVKTQAPSDIDNGLLLAKTYLSAKDLPTAVNQLTELSKLEPNKYEVWESLSDAQFDSGMVNEALDSAEMAIKVNPFSVKPYLLKAQVDLDNGLLEKAYEQVKEADQRVKDDATIKVFLAKVLSAKGEKSAALAALEEATHCQNLTPQMILEEIRLVKEINGSASARNLIEYFTKQMPENTELLSLLAESQLENGDSHGAEVTARRVLKLKPDSKNMLLFIGKQQLKKGQLDQAIHSFSQVINLDSNNLEAHYRLNDAYCEQRQTTKALESLQRIIEIDPTQTDAYIKMAAIYKDSKNYKQAEEMLKKAVELEPKNVSIKRQLGALLALNLVHQSQEVSSQL